MLTLWDAQVAAFSRDHSVWRYDTRGHGESDAPAGEYSLERLGKDLIAVIDATGAERVDLCGVSIGGLTALWTAVHAPDRVRRLILANTAARIGDVDSVVASGSVPRAPTACGRSRRPPCSAGLPTISRAPTRRRRHAFARRSNRPTSTATWAVVPRCGMPICGRWPRQVACPTLIVTGRQDVATPPDEGRWLGERIRGARAWSNSTPPTCPTWNVRTSSMRQCGLHGRP